MNLTNARFDESFLSGADFSGSILTGATFISADLGGANFFASNLTRASLSWPVGFAGIRPNSVENTMRRDGNYVPFLGCAILDGADLTALPLMYVQRTVYGQNKYATSIQIPNMKHAHVDSTTKLGAFGVVYVLNYTQDYYNSLSIEERRSLEENFVGPGALDSIDWFASEYTSKFSSGNIRKVGNNEIISAIREKEFISAQGQVGEVSDWFGKLIMGSFGTDFWLEEPITRDLYVKSVSEKPRSNEVFSDHDLDCNQASSGADLLTTRYVSE
jgi:hypothetical protein